MTSIGYQSSPYPNVNTIATTLIPKLYVYIESSEEWDRSLLTNVNIITLIMHQVFMVYGADKKHKVALKRIRKV